MEEIETKLNTNIDGLIDKEVEKRIKKYGRNTLPKKKKDSVLIENKYYVQYVKSKQEMLYQLQNFEKMFLTLSENCKKEGNMLRCG